MSNPPLSSAASPSPTENELRQLLRVVNMSQDAIISTTLDGIITSWNGGAQRMFGYTPEEVIGKSGSTLFPPEMWTKVPSLLKKIEAKEFVADYDIRGLRKDGTIFDLAISISPITEDDLVIGASVVERDITLRRKTEQLLNQTQQLVENSLDAIIGETPDGIITSWNKGAQKMFGYTPEEIIGKSGSELFFPEMKKIFPGMLEKIKSGEPVTDFDAVRMRKDGSRINVSITFSPVHDENDKITGISVIQRDITEHHKAEQAIRESVKKFEAYTNKAPIGIFVTDAAGHYLDANPMACQMSGYSKDELLQISVKDFLTPASLAEGMRINQTVRMQGFAQAEILVRKKNGEEYWINIVSSKIDEDHDLAFCLDITEKKQSELHIKELYEVRSKFIDIISHQLRTPLTAVNWNLETLLDGTFGQLEETQRKFLLATHQSSLEITRRIHNLITAIDIEEGHVRYTSEEVALDSVCTGVVNAFLKKAELKNITVKYDAPTTLKTIWGDGEKLRMAISALIENAIVYSNENGTVSIFLKLIDNNIRFEVTDSGVGIPKSEQNHIFTRFFRASNASVMQPDAFGLGLFIAKNFVQQHEGNISFDSTEGKGSTFWFEIPLRTTHSKL